MNCTDLLSHLSDYFDEQLSPKLLEEIRTHTASCQHCKVVLDTTHLTLDDVVARMETEVRRCQRSSPPRSTSSPRGSAGSW